MDAKTSFYSRDRIIPGIWVPSHYWRHCVSLHCWNLREYLDKHVAHLWFVFLPYLLWNRMAFYVWQSRQKHFHQPADNWYLLCPIQPLWEQGECFLLAAVYIALHSNWELLALVSGTLFVPSLMIDMTTLSVQELTVWDKRNEIGCLLMLFLLWQMTAWMESNCIQYLSLFSSPLPSVILSLVVLHPLFVLSKYPHWFCMPW